MLSRSHTTSQPPDGSLASFKNTPVKKTISPRPEESQGGQQALSQKPTGPDAASLPFNLRQARQEKPTQFQGV